MHCASAGPPVTLNGVVTEFFCQKFSVRQASSRAAGPGPAVSSTSYRAYSGAISAIITRRCRDACM